MSATVEQASPQVHRTAARFQCPKGHAITTQAASGQPIKCSGCLAAGETVLVEVPRRPGEAAKTAKPVRPPESASRDVTATCRVCGATALGGIPPGWVVLLAGADPATTKNGKPFRRLGPWCSARCAAAGLQGAVQTAGVRPGPRQADRERGEFARLMTEPPRGRAS